jgi:serine/threonine protein kinase
MAARSTERGEAATPSERRLGAYILLDRIGRGASGEVYRARHAVLGTTAAVKVLSSALPEDDHERFEREARTMASVRHAGTPAVYDYGRTEDGTSFYVMELIEGPTLAELVDRDGPQSPERAARIVLEVCAALRATHGAGLVHGDIKPDNIVLYRRGGADAVKVLDFGLARAVGRDDGDDASEVVVGTPAYMPPEAVLAPASADPRSDLYAVGALAYCLLTGHPPFSGDSVVEVLSRQLYAEPEPLRQKTRSVPVELERIVLDCLAKDPDSRPATAGALIERLERVFGRNRAEQKKFGAPVDRCRSALVPIDVWA